MRDLGVADLAVNGGATREELAVLVAVVTQLTPQPASRDPYSGWRHTRQAAMRRADLRRAATNGSDSLSW